VTSCRVDIPAAVKTRLFAHLFPGDHGAHAAVLAAALVRDGSCTRLLVRHLLPAIDGIDYVTGSHGQHHLRADFVRRGIAFCREHSLAYLAVHNHGGDYHVAFSRVDHESHERAYPALIDLMQGRPVGAIVFATNAAAGEIWWNSSHRCPVDEVRVIGHTIQRLGAGSTITVLSRPASTTGKSGCSVPTVKSYYNVRPSE